jgi:hypothetical protein
MSAGISRVHGYTFTPSQRPSTISFYTVTFPSMDIHTSEANLVNGVFDQVFRTAIGQQATVAMIGTPVYASSNTTINFAVEDTGVDTNSVTGLAQGNANNNYGNWATTALSFQAAVRALGSSVGPNAVNLSSVTVATFTL